MIADEQLLLHYRSGDEDGFNELIERYRGPLFTVILRMVGDRGDAEDIFQETFYRVIRHRERFDAERKFSTWLYSIAVNLCRDYLRKGKRSLISPREELPDAPGPENPETDSWRREIGSAVESALAKLPFEQREVFLLREYGDMSFKEIAELTQSNLNTVLGRMHVAIRKLRAELSAFAEGPQ